MKESKRLKKWLKERNKIIDTYHQTKSKESNLSRNWGIYSSKKVCDIRRKYFNLMGK